MLTRFSFFVAMLAFGLVACEGPAGPMGPVGPQGPQGEIGPPREGVIIERQLSRSLYDADGNIFIEDDRITPATFQALYLKAAFPDLGPDAVAYMPLDYLISVCGIAHTRRERVGDAAPRRRRGFSPNHRH